MESYSYYGRDMQDSVSKIQKKYWSTKQILIKKFGRKEDDSIVASDAELDAKLELFSAIYASCVALERILENYQDRLAILSQEENAMGRFLKECGRQDKTRAGKMMTATGKSLAFTAQQRLTLRAPLVRLYQEVETYLVRAISDTETTVNKMEKSRTDYRGALLWMKEVSQKLDPDTFRQLEKFRKVQGHVKKTKGSFEKLKVDTLQKVDLLSASRCNMFSHALAAYQSALLVFWEKTAKALAEVAEGFKGYQYYEFTVVKELAEPSKKLAEETGAVNDPASPSKKAREEGDTDKALFYNPEWKDSPQHKPNTGEIVKGEEVKSNSEKDASSKENTAKQENVATLLDDDEPLLSLVNDATSSGDYSSLFDNLITGDSKGEPLGSFAKEWENTFGQVPDDSQNNGGKGDNSLAGAYLDADVFQEINLLDETINTNNTQSTKGATTTTTTTKDKLVLPSQLLTELSDFNPFNSSTKENTNPSPLTSPLSPTQQIAPSLNLFSLHKDNEPKPKESTESSAKPKKPQAASSGNKQDPNTWLSLFADLDPLANPDAIGAKKPQEERNC